MSTEWVVVQGQLVPRTTAALSLADHGLLFGDGLFETMGLRGGAVFALPRHLARLAAGLSFLGIQAPPSEVFQAAVTQLAERLEMTEGVLRITVTRGAGPPLPGDLGAGPASWFVTARPAPPPVAEPGLVLGLSSYEHPGRLHPSLKSLSYQPFALARREALQLHWDDALLTRAGYLVEASAANVAVVRYGEIHTPSLASGALAGVGRELLLELCRVHAIPVREIDLPAATLRQAEALMLVGSVRGILPVRSCGGREFAPHPLIQRLQQLWRQLPGWE